MLKDKTTRAQAMVEFALALPVFLLVVYGLMEAGRLVFMYSAAMSASREAARYASAWGIINDAGNQQYQDCAGIRATAKRVGFLLNLSDTNIHIYLDRETPPQTPPVTLWEYCLPANPDPDTTVGPATTHPVDTGDRIVVKVDSSYSPILPFFIPLTGQPISSQTGRTIMGLIDLNTPTPTSPP